MRALVALSTFLAMVAVTACSLLLSTGGVQCSTDGDCRARGAPFAGTTCVDSVCVVTDAGADARTPDARADVAADAPADAAADVDPRFACLGDRPTPEAGLLMVTATFWLHQFLNPSVGVTGVQVRLCPNNADPFCTGVLATATPDGTGHVTFTLDLRNGPFAGYLAVDPLDPDAGGAYAPARISYVGNPIVGAFTDDWQLGSVSDIQGFTQIYGLGHPNPAEGLTFLVLYDCVGNSLAGATVGVDQVASDTTAFYFVNNTPSTTASTTDSSGYAGYLNLPSGSRRFVVDYGSTHMLLSSVTLYSLGGVVTYGSVAPPFTQ